MTTLYTLTNEFLAVTKQLEELDLDPEAVKDTLDSLQAPIEEKVENIVKYIRSLEALAEAKKAEAKRLQESAATDLRRIEWLKEYTADNLRQANIQKLQAGLFSLGFRKGSEVVEIDETILPKEYFVHPEPKPMGKADLKKLLKEGFEIPGVSLVRKDDTLQIK